MGKEERTSGRMRKEKKKEDDEPKHKITISPVRRVGLAYSPGSRAVRDARQRGFLVAKLPLVWAIRIEVEGVTDVLDLGLPCPRAARASPSVGTADPASN